VVKKTHKNGLRILVAAILFLDMLSAASFADDQSIPKSLPENKIADLTGKELPDFPLEEIFAASQQEPGEAYYFFIPQSKDDADRYTYVYDTKLDRLLLLPKSKELNAKIEGREINPADWPGFLNELVYSRKLEARKAKDKIFSQIKVIELNENWVKFSLGRRHIVLPRQLMVEGWGEKNFPLGMEVVDKNNALPEDYAPDDLVKINQKWNFHTPDNPKYIRRYVAGKIGQMLQNAVEQGIHIRVFSAFRSYEKQRYLYLSAVSRYGEDQNRVAAPGHSEHQLGTTVDLCGLDPKTVLSQDFSRTKESQWMKESARKFGFSQSYTRENQHRTGYIPEPWHYRYVGIERKLFISAR
jgi:LAS superfamily LD-carboxypeptidase LdcB